MAHSHKYCEHLDSLKLIPASTYQCDKCIEQGDTWLHLRVCQTCGEVNCCDDSPNQHATRHHYATGHPVIISAEPGERWAWCYEDEEFMEY